MNKTSMISVVFCVIVMGIGFSLLQKSQRKEELMLEEESIQQELEAAKAMQTNLVSSTNAAVDGFNLQ